MIAHAVKESVGIRRDPRRGQRDQRTQRRGRTLQRKLVEQTAVHVGVKRWIVFQKVARLALDGDAFGRASYLQSDFEGKRHSGTHINVLRIRSKPRHVDTEMVRIEGNVREAESSRVIGGGCPVKLANRV